MAAGSVALVGFGLDSVVEASSGGVLVWRLRSERSDEKAERAAIRGVAVAFFALAVYVTAQSILDLVTTSRPDASPAGIALAALSLVVMPLLAYRKRVAARELNSRSLQADSMQTSL